MALKIAKIFTRYGQKGKSGAVRGLRGAGPSVATAREMPVNQFLNQSMPNLPQLLDALQGTDDVCEADAKLLVYHHHFPSGDELMIN